MKIGIILAMKEELLSIKKFAKNITENKIYNLEFLEGNINNIDVVLCQCGIGKVNAARCTQVLIDKYGVDCIINIGVAGGVNKSLNIGDIVVGQMLVQHDFDLTKFNHEEGYIPGVGKEIYSNEDLVELFINNFNSDNNKIIKGTIASGDIFCTEPAMSLKIYEKFNADCVEMEGAAIAQVSFLCNKPFIVIRSISDVVNGNNEVDFNKFLEMSSNRVAKLLVDVITKINL